MSTGCSLDVSPPDAKTPIKQAFSCRTEHLEDLHKTHSVLQFSGQPTLKPVFLRRKTIFQGFVRVLRCR